MANRRFEMFQYRQVLSRLRLGESSRSIARSGLMGRAKVEAFRRLAGQKGWLNPLAEMPDEATIAGALPARTVRPQTESAVLPYQEMVTKWWEQGIHAKRIHRNPGVRRDTSSPAPTPRSGASLEASSERILGSRQFWTSTPAKRGRSTLGEGPPSPMSSRARRSAPGCS